MKAAEPVCELVTTAVSFVAASDDNDSPSVNVAETLSVPEFLYLTNKVSGSVPSVATTEITSATTPDVPPVITASA